MKNLYVTGSNSIYFSHDSEEILMYKYLRFEPLIANDLLVYNEITANAQITLT